MWNPADIDFSELTPETVAWLQKFGRSLRVLGSFFIGVTDGEGDDDIHNNLQGEWPKETRGGREQLTQLIGEMSAMAGFLATESTPELRRSFIEIAIVLKRAHFAMNGEGTWGGDAFAEWLSKQEVQRDGTDLDQAGTTN